MASSFIPDHVDAYTADKWQFERIHTYHVNAAESMEIADALKGYIEGAEKDLDWAMQFVVRNTAKVFREEEWDGALARCYAEDICQILRKRLPILKAMLDPTLLGAWNA